MRELHPATRAVVTLWVLTTLLCASHPQSAIAWLNPAPELSKWHWALPNLALAFGALAFPGSRALLVILALLAALTQSVWHSWLGALPPWIPLFLAGLAVFSRSPAEDRKSAALDSLLIALLLSWIHRLNGAYLEGYEFGPEGMFGKLFPAAVKPWLQENAAMAAKAWLALLALPIGLAFLRRRKAALTALALNGAIACLLHDVLFYGYFLLVPLVLALDPAFLNRWRRGVGLPGKPKYLYYAGMAGFFLWYLVARDSVAVYVAVLAVSAASALLAEPPAIDGTPAIEGTPAPLSSLASRRAAIWLAALLAFLASPLLATSIPAPFAATHFSARDARIPPEHWIPSPAFPRDCRTLRVEYALRWGYRIRPTPTGCEVAIYR